MRVQEAWAAIKNLDRYGMGNKSGSFVYALHAEAAARDAMLMVHDEACDRCYKRRVYPEAFTEECPIRAEIEALA